MSTHAPNVAIRLLHDLLEQAPGGRVFTSQEAVSTGHGAGLSAAHTYKLLSELTARGLLERPRGRLYVMRPPFGGLAPVHPLAIAVRAVQPAAVSGDAALVHWGLHEQAPLREETVSTSARIQWADGVQAQGSDRLWPVAGATIRFRRVPAHAMFGITSVRLDAATVVPMFDRERAVLELLTGTNHGSGAWAEEIIQTRSRDVDLPRLRDYARRLGVDGELRRILARRPAAPAAVAVLPS